MSTRFFRRKTVDRIDIEAADLEEALSVFRTSVRKWSEKRYTLPQNLIAPEPSPTFRPSARYLWLAAAACLCAFLLNVGHFQDGAASRKLLAVSPIRAGFQPSAALSDSALLSQLDEEVSRTAPAPMEPLAQLTYASGQSARA